MCVAEGQDISAPVLGASIEFKCTAESSTLEEHITNSTYASLLATNPPLSGTTQVQCDRTRQIYKFQFRLNSFLQRSRSNNRLPVKVVYIRTSYFRQSFSNGCNIHMVQWHGVSWTHHRPKIVTVRFLGTAEGFLLTGPELESCWYQLSFWVPVAPIGIFA